MDVSPARHTIVVSDLHLTEVEEPDPRRPLWMRYKHRDLIIDGCFARFVDWLLTQVPPDSELILDGDVFDFDAVRAIPTPPPFGVNWLERLRGLAPEQAKSAFKMGVILRDHEVFVQALRSWVTAGHRLVLVVGNHDIEVLWPAVREVIHDVLDLPDERRDAVRICEWFYVSGGDTLVEHGSQYDAYCVCPDPLHPTFRLRSRELMRVPFGDMAERLLLNGMGLFNPYVESSFIKPPLEYAKFFLRHIARIQPLIGWTWLWGAIATGVLSLRNGFLPSIRDPITLEERGNDAAERANVPPATLRALGLVRVHPAVFNPWKILKELWLDRALILALIVFGSFWLIGLLNIFGDFSVWWAVLFFFGLLPPFAFYARSVNSDVGNTNRALKRKMPLALRIAGVRRAVIGHTHQEGHVRRGDTELLNTGTWSAAYEDVEYTRPFGRKCFAWIHPDPDRPERIAELFEWTDPGCAPVAVVDDTKKSRLKTLSQKIPIVGRKQS